MEPSVKPSASPSATPSFSPSNLPSDVPSSIPSSMPSGAPSVKICESNEGVFGSVDGDGVTVEYAYELEADTTKELIDSDVLPVLEQVA